ncbi:zinc-binding dehydrogenase [Streptomyces sp. IBSBF 2435]
MQRDRPYFRPVVSRTFGPDAVVEPHRYLESGEQIGKIVLTVPR